MEDHSSITRFLMLGTLETLINQALQLDQPTSEPLYQLHGTVIRVRCEKPTLSIYLLICEDGIEILHDYEGHVDIRLRASLGALLEWILAPGSRPQDDPGIRITGPENQVAILAELIDRFNLWLILKNWLEHHAHLDEVLRWLRREDPRWLAKLEALTSNVDIIGQELGRQRLLLEDVLEEIKGFKQGLRRERQLDMLMLCSGMLLLLAAFASATGQLSTLGLPALQLNMHQGLQTLLLSSLGLTLILSRLLFGHRYPRT